MRGASDAPGSAGPVARSGVRGPVARRSDLLPEFHSFEPQNLAMRRRATGPLTPERATGPALPGVGRALSQETHAETSPPSRSCPPRRLPDARTYRDPGGAADVPRLGGTQGRGHTDRGDRRPRRAGQLGHHRQRRAHRGVGPEGARARSGGAAGAPDAHVHVSRGPRRSRPGRGGYHAPEEVPHEPARRDRRLPSPRSDRAIPCSGSSDRRGARRGHNRFDGPGWSRCPAARETLALVRDGRNDEAAALHARDTLGTPAVWTAIGPLQPLRMRDFNKPSAFDDPTHVLAATYASPLGSVAPRVFQAPEGGLDLEADPWRADVLRSAHGREREARWRISPSRCGAPQRRPSTSMVSLWRSACPSRSASRPRLGARGFPAGQHRIRVHFARVDSGWVAVQLGRADGLASDSHVHRADSRRQPPPVTAHALPARSWGAIAAVDRVIASGLSPVDRFLRLQHRPGRCGDRPR